MKPTPDFDPKTAAKKLLREGRSARPGDADAGLRRSLLLLG